jgi:hypothetical protein
LVACVRRDLSRVRAVTGLLHFDVRRRRIDVRS